MLSPPQKKKKIRKLTADVLREDQKTQKARRFWGNLSVMQTNIQIIIIVIINPLTARVVGAPQMILQPVFSIFPCLHCPVGLAELQACPFPNVVYSYNDKEELKNSHVPTHNNNCVYLY